MVNLTKVETGNGLEIFIDHSSGESYTSVSGYARMSGKGKGTISDRITVRKVNTKTAEILTATGEKTVRLIDEKLIAEWLPLDNPSMATKLIELGVRKFLHTLAGFNPTPKPTLPVSYADALRELAATVEAKELAEQKVLEQTPKVELAESYLSTDGLTTIDQFSKDVNIKGLGRNNMYKWLRNEGYLQADNVPYQKYVSSGMFLLKPSGFFGSYGSEVTAYKTYLTPSGVETLNSRLK